MPLTRRLTAAALLACAGVTAWSADLTTSEQRWLKAGWPVVLYAKAQQLPLDIIVQPASKAGDAPLAMGYRRGQCLLVLTMRGNPGVDSALEGVAADLSPVVVEAMFAHEIGHCWRHVNGSWHSPATAARDAAGAAGNPALAQAERVMSDTRSEEGYADLVALAWTRSHHPAQYAQVHAWLAAYRADQPVAGAHHDTRAWIDLAADPDVFGRGGTPFEQAEPVWRRGLAGSAH